MPVNRVLTDVDRAELQPVCDRMREYWPELYSRKIDRSMVQYAFCYDTVLALMQILKDRSTVEVLAIGAQECIASECLKMDGYNVVSIDPIFNCTLNTFVNRHTDTRFDIVLAASVLEHVEDIEEFIADACKCLYEKGYGVFTVDFQNEYVPGNRLPYTDLRFFTEQDLSVTLRNVLKANGCYLVDEPDYSAADNFHYDGCTYSFATFVFKKG